jgi:hypothetical protein
MCTALFTSLVLTSVFYIAAVKCVVEWRVPAATKKLKKPKWDVSDALLIKTSGWDCLSKPAKWLQMLVVFLGKLNTK